MFSGKFYSEQM